MKAILICAASILSSQTGTRSKMHEAVISCWLSGLLGSVKNFYFLQHVHMDSESCSDCYERGLGGLFPWGKAAGVRS
jgi:hypothetical protein